MRANEKRAVTALIILTLAFIWGNSLLPPKASWAVSDVVRDIIAAILPGEATLGGESAGLGVLVRKLAHFTEFCILGGLLRIRWREESRGGPVPFLLGLLAAAVDETIQAFTGRTSSVFDVWIDFSGVSAGIFLTTWLAGISPYRGKRELRGGKRDHAEKDRL